MSAATSDLRIPFVLGFLSCVNLLVRVFALSVTWLGCGTTHHGHESGVEVRALHCMPTKDTRRLLLAHGRSIGMKNENDEDLARSHEVCSYVKVRSFFVWFDSFFFRSIVVGGGLEPDSRLVSSRSSDSMILYVIITAARCALKIS